MARKSSRRSASSQRRVSTQNANIYRSQPMLPFDVPLTSIEDRRTFHPDNRLLVGPPTRSFLLSDTPIVTRPPTPRMLVRNPHRMPSGLAFQAPREVLVCVRRQQRREVLHALGRAGRSGPQRRPRRNLNSNISCKR